MIEELEGLWEELGVVLKAHRIKIRNALRRLAAAARPRRPP